MSQKNVAGWIRRKSDGAIYEVLYYGILRSVELGHNYVRIGPAGQHRSKRRWESIEEVLRDYGRATKPDAVDPADGIVEGCPRAPESSSLSLSAVPPTEDQHGS